MNANDQLPLKLLAECESLLIRLAPELSAAPVYALNCPADYPGRDRCLAFTTVGAIDFMVRDQLIAESRYRGPGTAIVFCAGDLPRDQVLALTLHEGAHRLPFRQPSEDCEPTPALREFQRLCLEVGEQQREIDETTKPRWANGHDYAFIRVCLHLHRRAWLSGSEIGAGDIQFAGHQYDLSPHWMYLRAIGDEPARMVGENFETILATKPPVEFSELWRADLVAFAKANPDAIRNYFLGANR